MITHYISKHLKLENYKDIEKCCICGERGEAIKSKKIFSGNFNDWQYIKFDSEYICNKCASCFSSKAFDGKALRNYSVLITDDLIEKINRQLILQTIKNPPKKFAMIVTFSQKKHCFYQAKINTIEPFRIATDKYTLDIYTKEFLDLYYNLYKLYDLKFSKTEILSGNYSTKNMKKAGGDLWEIDEKISKYRFTNLIDFSVWLLHKEEK